MSITDRGFIFSLDILVCSLALLFMIFIAASQFSEKSHDTVNGLEKFALQKNAFLLADSMVKNKSANATIGSALFDFEKRRVKSNEIDSQKLKGAAQISSEEFFVKKIFLRTADGLVEEIFYDNTIAKQCIGTERLVLVENKKAIVEVLFCEK